MVARSLTFHLVAPTLALGVCVACANRPAEGDAPVVKSEQAILNGALADDAKYGAVGAVLFEEPWGLEPVCSGTLVAPTAVVTAKHCTKRIAAGEQAYFAVGIDMSMPDQVIPITSYVAAPASTTHPGLMQNGGRDVAVAYLESAPEGITPAKIGKFTDCMLGSPFEIAGYGISESWGMYGLRYSGQATARALGGNWYKQLFNGDKQAYLDWYWTDAPDAEPSDAEAQQWWKTYKLEPGYELLAGGLPGEAVGCHGDSGGPLMVGTSTTDLTVYGVSFAVEDSLANACDNGGAYVVFHKDVLKFVKAAIALR